MASTARYSLWTGILLGSSATLIVTVVYRKVVTKRNSPKASQKLSSTRPSQSASVLPPSLRAEQLSRSALYFGDDNMVRLSKHSRVCVVGVGGVGSHAAVALARAGLGPLLRLVDFDQVTLSSLNRHACATLADVGIPKVTCVEQHIRKICPHDEYLHVDARVELFDANSADRLLHLPDNQQWDMVIDAIDDVPTKAQLIQYCLRQKIPVISCMGAGGKADVTRLHVGDLQSAAKDPLATKLRQTLRRIMKNSSGSSGDGADESSYLQDTNQLSILYSSEKTVVKLSELTPEQQAAPHTFGAMDHMRLRVVPVLGTMPAIMGMSLAAICLTRLGNKPVQPVPGERMGKTVRHRTLQHLKSREATIRQQVLQRAGIKQPSTKELMGSSDKEEDDVDQDDEDETNAGSIVDGTWIGRVQVDMDDIDYLFELWRNRCAVTGARLGTALVLTRWDPSRPSTTDNLLFMSTKALKQFDQPKGKDSIPEAVRRNIEARLASCRCDA